MHQRTLDFPFELKSVSPSGVFHGYASVFNVKDSYDEVVLPGAFAESLEAHKAAGRMPAMLWQHRSSEPVGVYTSMAEDSVGLAVEGQLAMKTARGAEAFELLSMNALSGLSIGFMVREDSFDRVTGVTTLKRIDLWEVSLVTFPANDAARVQGVKAVEMIEDIRGAENYLRDAGLSRREARAFLARVKGLSECDATEGELLKLTEAITRRGLAIPARP